MEFKNTSNNVRVNDRPVKSFKIQPQKACELQEVLERIVDRLTDYAVGAYREVPIYIFVEEELDVLSDAVSYLLDDPDFKKEIRHE